VFPLHDNNPRHGRPLVVLLLIAVNALAFLYEMNLGGRELEIFFYRFGFVPLRVHNAEIAAQLSPPGTLLTPFTSMFLHGSWWHLIGNMWMLWLFGDNVEDRFGHLRFLAFYLLCGLAGTAAHYITAMRSPIPTIGASGAIAGVMGAYFLLFPRARIVTLVFFFFLIDFVELPAILFLGFWILLQLFSGTMTLGAPDQAGGVAFWAHVGGFLAGALLLFPMMAGRPAPRSALWKRRGY
jgi:membrane associated rhomboid family serine protease